jgi:DNA topoisomerase III
VEALEHNESFGNFAQRVGSGELWQPPKKGKNDDKAHPPIHPVKNAPRAELSNDEWRIYELLSRHFLATISRDAVGSETIITVTMGGEGFHCKGIIVE